MKKLFGYFLQGLLFTVPLAATLYLVYKAIVLIDGIIPFKFPGLGILIIVVSMTLIGLLGSTLIVNQFLSLDKILDRIPLLKIIYTSVKDLLSAFVGKKKRFTQPVLVKMEGNVERFGFITQNDLTELGVSADKIGVYIPFSYAVTGNLIVVPKDCVTPVDANSADIMKLIISGGVTEIEEEN